MSNELFSMSYARVMRIDRCSPACVEGDISSELAGSREIATVNAGLRQRSKQHLASTQVARLKVHACKHACLMHSLMYS